MNKFANVSNEELQAELTRRADEKKQKALEDRRAKFALLMKHRDALLHFVPHGRTSCSDEKVVNGFGSEDYGPRCTRCALLKLDEWNADDHDFTFELHFTKVEE